MTEMLTQMQALPSETPLEDEALAAYEKKFREDNTIWAELLQENLDRLGRGSFSLHWMNTDKANWVFARARVRGVDLYRHQPPASLRHAARAHDVAQLRPARLCA